MTDSQHRHPTRIRTFAADLEAKRNEQGLNETPEAVISVKNKNPEPVPQAETPKSFKTVAHQEEATATPIPKTSSKPDKLERTKIPSFHELQKNTPTIQEHITAESIPTERPVPKKKSSGDTVKPERSARPNIGYDATVITDRQSEHFKLFPAIIASLKEWFKAQKKKRAPKYTVTETERRKGVIQRATTKAGTLFTADNETLREQIRRRRTHILGQTSDGITETIWSPFTETGYTLLEGPDEVQNVVVSYKKPHTPHVIKSTKHPIAIIEPSQTFSEKVTVVEPTPPPLVEPKTEEQWVASSEEEAAEISAVIPEETAELIVEESPEPTPRTVPIRTVHRTKQNLLTALDTNTLTVMLLLTIVAVVAIIFVSRLLYIKFTEAPIETASTKILSEPILPTATVVSVPLTVQTLDSLPGILAASIASSSTGLTEYIVVSSIGDEVSPSYLFELLGFKTIPSMRQSLLSIHFATAEQVKPTIILTFTDTDTVHGGLLAWETTMADDMRTFYNLPTEIGSAFVDEEIAGNDVRILRHDGEIVLLYSIVTNNLAIISNTRESFTRLVEASVVK